MSGDGWVTPSIDLIKKIAIPISSELKSYLMTKNLVKKRELFSHHYKIAFNNFTNWFANQPRFAMMSNVNDTMVLRVTIFSGSAEYKINNQSIINRIQEPDTMSSQEALQHLQSGKFLKK